MFIERDDDQVVHLNRFQTMQHPAMAQIEGYWEGLRRGRPVPLRAEVDPRGIDQALENAFILERIAPGMARFRLAGMHLNDLMGMEVRGMPLTAFFDPDARRQVTDALEHLFEEPAKIRILLSSAGGAGRPELSGSLILLPLKSDLGDISRALGCFVTDGEPGRTPRRFGLDRLDIRPLLGDSLQEKVMPLVGDTSKPKVAKAPAKPVVPAVQPGLQEAATPYDHPATRKSGTPKTDEDAGGPHKAGRAYLKLVHSRD